MSRIFSEKASLLIKTFFGLECDIISLIENLSNEYILINLRPELVEKKDPPMIIKIKKINDKWLGVSSIEIPILDTLLAIDRKSKLK